MCQNTEKCPVDLLSLKPSANTDVKNNQESKRIENDKLKVIK